MLKVPFTVQCFFFKFTSGEHRDEDDAARPNVRRLGLVRLDEHFGCDVRQRAALLVQHPLLAFESGGKSERRINYLLVADGVVTCTAGKVPKTLPKHGRHSEVADLHVVAVVEQNVLGFQVAVGDAARVQVLDAREDLFEVALGVVGRHANVGLCVTTWEVVTQPIKLCCSLCHSPIRSNNSPPAAYSRKMYSMVPCERLPKNLRMFGCVRIFWMQTSFFTDCSASGCFCRSTIFIATASPDSRLISNFTLRKLIENNLKMELLRDLLAVRAFAQRLSEVPILHKLSAAGLRCHFVFLLTSTVSFGSVRPTFVHTKLLSPRLYFFTRCWIFILKRRQKNLQERRKKLLIHHHHRFSLSVESFFRMCDRKKKI